VTPTQGIEEPLRRLVPTVVGALVRRYGHLDGAEDATREALLAAATQWPKEGVPEAPRSWLITVASRRLIDELRSAASRSRREATAGAPTPFAEPAVPGPDVESPTEEDDTLRLLFMCCHPALSPASQIALTLRAVGGLSTAEIARAFLVPEATMAQRISRAKQAIRDAGARFTLPRGRSGPSVSGPSCTCSN
jgi:RNA polymerase sigma factor (sigma-70 family)